MKLKVLLLSASLFIHANIMADSSACDKYFAEFDQYLDLVTKSANKDQVKIVKDQAEQLKKQIEDISDKRAKEKACETALKSIREAKKILKTN